LGNHSGCCCSSHDLCAQGPLRRSSGSSWCTVSKAKAARSKATSLPARRVSESPEQKAMPAKRKVMPRLRAAETEGLRPPSGPPSGPPPGPRPPPPGPRPPSGPPAVALGKRTLQKPASALQAVPLARGPQPPQQPPPRLLEPRPPPVPPPASMVPSLGLSRCRCRWKS